MKTRLLQIVSVCCVLQPGPGDVLEVGTNTQAFIGQ